MADRSVRSTLATFGRSLSCGSGVDIIGALQRVSNQPIERPRGTYDRLPDDRDRLRELDARLSQNVTSSGYRFVETPVIEHTELFVRKSGGERLAQTFEFQYRGRNLALRPEHTASIIRLYVEQLQAEPLPVRLAYSGPVFRYESPQAGRSRQFTEFGCEMIGAGSNLADVEIVNLALHCVMIAGVQRPSLTLGHIGIVLALLDDLELDERTRDWLIWSMERIRRGDPEATEIPAHLIREPDEGTLNVEAAPNFSALDRDAMIHFLEQTGVDFEGGSRSAVEIVQGLFDRRKRTYNADTLRSAIEFIEELLNLRGHHGEVMPAIRSLVDSRGLNAHPLDELESMLAFLSQRWGDQLDINLDLGLGRGLRYYTGMLFEIYPDAIGDGLQLAGGGRYDGLAQSLGARQNVPACGFSVGLERLLLLSEDESNLAQRPRILVIPTGDDIEAVRLAEQFRSTGWEATLEVRGRGFDSARRRATRQGFDAVACVDKEQVATTHLRDNIVTNTASAPTPRKILNNG